METIRDNTGRILGNTTTNGNKTIVRDFKSGKIVSSYDSKTNTTWECKTNTTSKGNQAVRFLK